MKIKIKSGLLEISPADALVLFVREGVAGTSKKKRSPGSALTGIAGRIDKVAGGIIADLIKAGDFTGKQDETTLLYTRGSFPSKRIILSGLGEAEKFSADSMRRAVAAACRRASDLKIGSIAASLDDEFGDLTIDQASEALAEGFMLSGYYFDRYKADEGKKPRVKELHVYVDDRAGRAKLRNVKESLEAAETVCEAVLLARDLSCAPANLVTPAAMTRKAFELSAPNLKVKALGPSEMKKLGMNAVLCVAQGSNEPASFIIMEYAGKRGSDERIVIAGKAITFDSGGISLKPAEKMEEMKADMSGGAAVIAVMKAVAALKLPVNIVGLVPAAENLPGGKAYKPGDMIKTMSGLTVEVISTDAEGRMLLADALTYAAKYKPAALIDIATLTGACHVALGDNVCGMFSNDERLKSLLVEASSQTGEKVWELPLVDEYRELIKSNVADLKNTGGRFGGAITAALFLNRFAGDVPWAHLDIAGPAWSSSAKGYVPMGATGFGVRLLVSFVKNWLKRQ